MRVCGVGGGVLFLDRSVEQGSSVVMKPAELLASITATLIWRSRGLAPGCWASTAFGAAASQAAVPPRGSESSHRKPGTEKAGKGGYRGRVGVLTAGGR